MYYLPISAGLNIPYRTVIFKIDTTPVILTDTFSAPVFQVEEIINPSYLSGYYDVSNPGKGKFYRISIFSKIIPSSVVNHNPHYTMRTEFVLVKDNIYYDRDGTVIKFAKLK